MKKPLYRKRGLFTAVIAGFLLAIVFVQQRELNKRNPFRTAQQERQQKPPNDSWYIGVSMIRLIANPEAYEGKRVQVIGYMNIEFEGDAVYLHEEDEKRGIPKNALWVDIPKDIGNAKPYHHRYILIEGTFTAKTRGHFDAYSGTITKVTRFQRWEL